MSHRTRPESAPPAPVGLAALAAVAALAAITALAACADPAAPSFSLPAMDSSLDPGDLAVGELIATPCGDNAHLLGRHESAFVDVFFGREEHDPVDAPKPADVRLVQRYGYVVYRFNVPAVRAWMRLDRVPELVREGFWITVRDVPDPSRYDHPVIVGFADMTDDHLALFRQLGGRVEYRYEHFDMLAGPLPDRSIPHLRAGPDVLFVEPVGVACLAGAGAGPGSRP